MFRTLMFVAAFAASLFGSAGYAMQSWHTNDKYPPKALREHREGTTYFSVTIGTDGKAKNCVVTKSSGSADLDEAACAIFVRRARFSPATDPSGIPIEASYSNKFVWRIPD